MALHWHPPAEVPSEPPPDLLGATHASRSALRRVLDDPADDGAWDFLAESYAEMAAEWPEWLRTQPWHNTPVRVGARHARDVAWACEVGCGTGDATVVLADLGARIVATDVNKEMISLAPSRPTVDYVISDVRRLPLRDGSVPLLVGLNAVPHIGEFNRVIAGDGQLLWCTSFGAGTPLYVEPEELLRLLGPGWAGEAGRAGHGEWMLLTRDAQQ
jgi:SAM-dependent methyltransferase